MSLTPEDLRDLREQWTGSRERLARMLDAMDVHMRATRGHGLPREVMALGNVFHPEAVVLGLLDALAEAQSDLAEARGYGASDYAADLCRVMEGRGVPVPPDAHGAFEQCLRMIGTMDVPGEARRQRDDEAAVLDEVARG